MHSKSVFITGLLAARCSRYIIDPAGNSQDDCGWAYKHWYACSVQLTIQYGCGSGIRPLLTFIKYFGRMGRVWCISLTLNSRVVCIKRQGIWAGRKGARRRAKQSVQVLLTFSVTSWPNFCSIVCSWHSSQPEAIVCIWRHSSAVVQYCEYLVQLCNNFLLTINGAADEQAFQLFNSGSNILLNC